MWDLDPGVSAEPRLGTLRLAGNKRHPGTWLLSPHLYVSLWPALSSPDSHPQLSPGTGHGLV